MAIIDQHREKNIYRFFRASIFLKGMLSLAEIFAGITVLFITPATIGNAIIRFSANELADEPGSFWAIHTLHLAQQFSLTPRAFLAIYLLSRGVIKLALVIALLKNQLWAYPAAIAVLGGFMIYQAYEIFLNHSIFLILLTLFDVIVLWLIVHEYRMARRHVDPSVLA